MIKWSLVPILLLLGGCGSLLGGTTSTARTICANGGFSAEEIDESFDNIRQRRDDGFTRTVAEDVSARLCVDRCGNDEVCGQACINCTFAIVDEVY